MTREPAAPATILEALDAAAAGAHGIRFIDAEENERSLSWEALLAKARAAACGLQSLGVRRGDTVAMVLPDEEEFVTAFFAITLAGGVAVPMAPPIGVRRLGSFIDVCRNLVTRSHARVLVTNASLRSVTGTLRGDVRGLGQIVTLQELGTATGDLSPVAVDPDDPALLQFTSGSTSSPKGVVLSHRNLSVNCRVIAREGLLEPGTTPAESGEVPVSWLPLFHDMGLIGFVLTPLFAAMPTTLMPPLLFLRRPAAWLRALSRLRGSITYAPNFAYAFSARRVRDTQLEGVDLSHVRVFGCGAEPIRAATLREFVTRFEKYGVREEMFVPSYGMAESTLAISFGRGIPVDLVDRAALAERHVAQPAENGCDVLEVVGCGRTFSGHALRVVDPETETELPERHIGEIRIKGPSVTGGYFEAPEANAGLFDDEGWLRTGDLGYLADDEVYLCGRIKDLIIIRGRNYYPQDIEWAASRVEGVRKGCVLAFARRNARDGRDELVVLAESRTGHDHEELERGIRDAVRDAVGLSPEVVSIVARDSIPKTSSGKLKRHDARERFELGRLAAEKTDSPLAIAGRLLESQWAHFRSRLFGPRA